MVASTPRIRVNTRRVYALGALAAVLFGYDGGIIGAAILFIPQEIPLPPWQQGVVVGAMVFGAMLGAPRHRVWTTAVFIGAVLLFVLAHRTARQEMGRSWVSASAGSGRR